MKICLLSLILCLNIAMAEDFGGGAGGGNRVPATQSESMVQKIMSFFKPSKGQPQCRWANKSKTEVICDQQLFKRGPASKEKALKSRSN